MNGLSSKRWNDFGFWEYPCGCAQFQDGWEKCGDHEGRLISTDPSIQEVVVDNPHLMKGTWTDMMPEPIVGNPRVWFDTATGSHGTVYPAKQLIGLPTDASERKNLPIASGVLDYFPDALAEVAKVSKKGNDQHNGVDTPLKWDRSKSTDEADALIRHFIERGKIDSDGQRHSAKVAWRSLALLQKELEDA